MSSTPGRIAARNIAGKSTDIHSVPIFWTVLCGKSLRYTGKHQTWHRQTGRLALVSAFVYQIDWCITSLVNSFLNVCLTKLVLVNRFGTPVLMFCLLIEMAGIECNFFLHHR